MINRWNREDLMDFLGTGLSPWHVIEALEDRLEAGGFREKRPEEGGTEPFYCRIYPGVLLALRPGKRALGESAMLWALSHVDSPGFKVKRMPDHFDGMQRYRTETYGGPVKERFLDVPLRMAGRVFTQEPENQIRETLFAGRTRGVMPSLAPHLGPEGEKIDAQNHLAALWSLQELPFMELLAREAQVEEEAILSYDVFLVPEAGPRILGATDELIHSPRLDDLALVHSALQGLLEADPGNAWQGALFCNHEEVGSLSREGALSGLLENVLERVGEGQGLNRAGLRPVLERSALLSLDMAHGFHPGYPEAFDRETAPLLGAGPAVKLSAAGRYASDPREEAHLRRIARKHGISLQTYQNRSNLKGGTTLGPMASAASSLAALDVGVPMLSMHSAGEVAALQDIQNAVDLIKYYFVERL